MGLKVSVTNLLTQLTPIAITSALTGFPATNLKTPQRPLALWKSTGNGGQAVYWDLGAVPAANAPGWLFVFVNVNAALMSAAANVVNAFVSPPLNQLLVPVENPITGRRNIGFWTPTFPYRYIGMFIAAGTPTDGQLNFQCGGVWFGPCLVVPDGLSAFITSGVIKPRQFLDAQNQQFEDYQDRGPARIRVTAERRGRISSGAVIGVNDDLSKWHALDRQWGGRQAAVLLTERDPSKAWIMRNIADLDFQRDPVRTVKNQIIMVESLGP